LKIFSQTHKIRGTTRKYEEMKEGVNTKRERAYRISENIVWNIECGESRESGARIVHMARLKGHTTSCPWQFCVPGIKLLLVAASANA